MIRNGVHAAGYEEQTVSHDFDRLRGPHRRDAALRFVKAVLLSGGWRGKQLLRALSEFADPLPDSRAQNPAGNKGIAPAESSAGSSVPANRPPGRWTSRELFRVLHGKPGYGGKDSNDGEEEIIIPIAVANPLSDVDFVVEFLELDGADRERSM